MFFLFLKTQYYYFPGIASYSRSTKQMLQSKKIKHQTFEKFLLKRLFLCYVDQCVRNKTKNRHWALYYKATVLLIPNSTLYKVTMKTASLKLASTFKKRFLSDILISYTCVQNYL